ncbi:hypothetical protein MHYP_G00023240 [Metynnis hypsauchen]
MRRKLSEVHTLTVDSTTTVKNPVSLARPVATGRAGDKPKRKKDRKRHRQIAILSGSHSGGNRGLIDTTDGHLMRWMQLKAAISQRN